MWQCVLNYTCSHLFNSEDGVLQNPSNFSDKCENFQKTLGINCFKWQSYSRRAARILMIHKFSDTCFWQEPVRILCKGYFSNIVKSSWVNVTLHTLHHLSWIETVMTILFCFFCFSRPLEATEELYLICHTDRSQTDVVALSSTRKGHHIALFEGNVTVKVNHM